MAWREWPAPLYVPQVGIINPSEFAPANSIEAVIWVAVGGRGTLTGAVIGAVLVNYGKTYFTAAARALLAVPARKPVCRGDAGLAARRRRHLPALEDRAAGAGDAPARRAGRGRVRTPMDARTTSALLYLDGINVSFDGFKALNNRHSWVKPGEMRAIIGPNGAGKTTMMDVVTGKTRPDTGDAVFDGSYDLTALDETEIAELGIGRKFQKADRVRQPHGRGQSPARPQRATGARAPPCVAGERRGGEPRQSHPGDHRLPTVRGRLAGSLAHGQKQCSRSACCLPRSPSCCWSTSRWPA